jgi:outer membrane immunogenic protein
MRVAISTIALLACTSLASAADLGGPYEYEGSIKDAPIAAAPYNWTGLYFGGHVGWATGEWDGSLRTAGANPNDVWDNPNQSYDFDGWLGGLQIGFNRQHGSIVWGLEADASWGDLEGSQSVLTKSGSVEWVDDFSIDAFGTIRGRLGFLITPRLLIYGTGGLAWAQTSLDHTVWHHEGKAPFDAITGRASTDETHIGWVAGAGGEWMLASNWTVRAEWMRVDLGEAEYHPTGTKYNFTTGAESGSLRSDIIDEVDLTFDVFRVGVNYKFGN